MTTTPNQYQQVEDLLRSVLDRLLCEAPNVERPVRAIEQPDVRLRLVGEKI